MSFCDNRNGNFLEKNTHQAIFLEKTFQVIYFIDLVVLFLKELGTIKMKGSLK